MTESCNFSLHHDLPDDSHTADNHAVHTKIRWLEYRPSQRRPPDLGDGKRYPNLIMKTYILVAACLLLVVAPVAALILNERRDANREYAAYGRLCDAGASGDDWVGFSEIVTGKPPIVQLNVPETVDRSLAFNLIPDMVHLESLSIAYGNLSYDELALIPRIGLNSLQFSGHYPQNADAIDLRVLSSIRFLTIPNGRLSDETLASLQSEMARTKIVVQ